MIASKVFNVVSKFHFEVGSAVIGANKLAKSVQGLESSLGNVQNQIKGFALGGALNLTGAQLGILGVLRKSIDASEEFKKIQIDIAQIMQANASKLKGSDMSWKALTEYSGNLAKSIHKESLQFGLDPNVYASYFKTFLPVLMAKGIAGDNLGATKQLSRNLLLSKDILNLGVHAEGNLLNMLSGLVNPRTQLWTRLTGETQEFKGMKPGAFKTLTPAKRLEKLNKAFEEFIEGSDSISARMNTISTQMKLLTYHFSSFDSVLRPIGDALNSIVLNTLKEINKFITNSFAPALMDLSPVFNLIPKDLDKMYVAYKKITSLSKDLEKAHSNAFNTYIAFELFHFIKFSVIAAGLSKVSGSLKKYGFIVGANLNKIIKFGTTLPVIGTGISLLVVGFNKLWVAIKAIRFSHVIAFLKFLGKGFLSYATFAGVFFLLRRIVTTAKEMGKAMDIEKGLTFLPKIAQGFSNLVMSLNLLMSPFNTLINTIAESIAKFFSVIYWMETFGEDAQSLTEKLLAFSKGFAQTFHVIFATIEWLIKDTLALVSPIHQMQGIQPYMEKWMSSYDERVKSILEKQPVLQASYNNYGNIEIKNQFDENFSPERIAITIKDQLIKSAQAPTSTPYRSLTHNPELASLRGN